MEEPEDLRRATELWQEAYRHQMDGELDRAMERYQRSIDVTPPRRRTPSWAGP